MEPSFKAKAGKAQVNWADENRHHGETGGPTVFVYFWSVVSTYARVPSSSFGTSQAIDPIVLEVDGAEGGRRTDCFL
jgi:hypothetical protein